MTGIEPHASSFAEKTRINNYGEFECTSVLIGVALNETPIIGVVHIPFEGPTGHTVYGVKGCGVFNLTSGNAPQLPLVDSSRRVLITSKSHWDSKIESAFSGMKEVTVQRTSGSGHKFLLLLRKHAHAYIYPRPGLKKWDTCACELLVRETGGQVTDVRGQCIDYSDTDNPLLSEGMVASAGSDELEFDHTWWVESLTNSAQEL